MAVTINIPSQVKTYANLAAFPVSGSLKTIYIAEDTNKTYRWTGSVYVEISASAAMTWGQIGGTLSNQTDLQNALDAKVPTARTLTINGVTQDLSADRTFTIATGLTVGTTPISSGTIGRVLFEGTGNVLQQSANLFWDNTNGRLGIGISSPSTTFAIGSGGINRVNLGIQAFEMYTPSSVRTVFLGYSSTSGQLIISSGGSNDVNFLGGGFKSISTGNFAIGSTTDAGFRLDVNGTARVSGAATIQTLTIGLGGGAVITNTALGNRVLEANTTGASNTIVGYLSLLRNTTGSNNVALGSGVLNLNITGSNNVGVGVNALRSATVNHNVGVGTEVLSATTTGPMNTAIGNYSLWLNTTGANNSALGYNTQSGNFSGSVIIGKDATATANNQFVIGSTGTNAGSVTTEVNASTQVWNVIINGVARKILLA